MPKDRQRETELVELLPWSTLYQMGLLVMHIHTNIAKPMYKITHTHSHKISKVQVRKLINFMSPLKGVLRLLIIILKRWTPWTPF